MKCDKHNIDLQYNAGYGGEICPKCDEEIGRGCQGCLVIMFLFLIIVFCFQEPIGDFLLWLHNRANSLWY